jgi:hypothetical protein
VPIRVQVGARPIHDRHALQFPMMWAAAVSFIEFQLSLVATAATLRLELERLEGRMSTGDDVDIDLYARTAGHFRRICETLGIERRKRNVTPSVHSYLDGKAA